MKCQTKAFITKLSCKICTVETLCSLEQKLFTDVSGQSAGPIFKGQNIQKTKQSMNEVN